MMICPNVWMDYVTIFVNMVRKCADKAVMAFTSFIAKSLEISKFFSTSYQDTAKVLYLDIILTTLQETLLEFL